MRKDKFKCGLKKIVALGLAGVMLFAVSACNKKESEDSEQTDAEVADTDKKLNPLGFGYFGEQIEMPEKGEEIVVFETSKGTIKARLFPDAAPKAVENFTQHIKDGYYNDMIFHRVIKDFMVQTGDPEGTGMGGESIWGTGFGPEVTPEYRFVRGALGMAQSNQPDSIGSQFFMVQNNAIDAGTKTEFESLIDKQEEVFDEDTERGIKYYVKDFYPANLLQYYIDNGGTPHLDFAYTVFGQIFEGLDVVDKIAEVETAGEDKPVEDVKLIKVYMEKY